LIAFELTIDELSGSWSEGSLVPMWKITVNNSPTPTKIKVITWRKQNGHKAGVKRTLNTV